MAERDLFARLRPGYCHRWHANPEMAGSECVDAHAARVGKIILHFWPDAPGRLLAAALSHDDGEMGLGDVAGPAKRAHPALAAILDRIEAENRQALGLPEIALPKLEALMLRLADKLAGLLHVRQTRPDLLRLPAWQADITALIKALTAAERDWPGRFGAMRAEACRLLPALAQPLLVMSGMRDADIDWYDAAAQRIRAELGEDLCDD